jgi:hypothetical protein
MTSLSSGGGEKIVWNRSKMTCLPAASLCRIRSTGLYDLKAIDA